MERGNIADLGLNISEKEYRDLPYVSYSALSKYDREGMYRALVAPQEEEETPQLSFGSLVDCLVTRPDDVAKEYAVLDGDPPSDGIKGVIEALVQTTDEPFIGTVDEQLILDAADAVGWQPRWKNDTRVGKIIAEGAKWFETVQSAKGMKIVSQKDMEDANHCLEALKTDPEAGTLLFGNKLEGDSIMRFRQLKLSSYDQKAKMNVKGMLDLVVIDTERKTITPVDLKTTKSVYFFEDSFWTWRYWIQAAVYTDLLRNRLHDLWLEYYEVEPFKFVAIDREAFRPIVFKWTPTDIVRDPRGRRCRTWREIAEDLEWASANVDGGLPKGWAEEYDKHGCVALRNYAV